MGDLVLSNASALQWIVDDLFVSNRRSGRAVRLFAGARLDLSGLKLPPILRSLSWRASFAPLRWALGWILRSKLYGEGTAARSRSGFHARSEQGGLEDAVLLTQLSPKNERCLTWVGPLFAVEPRTTCPAEAGPGAR